MTKPVLAQLVTLPNGEQSRRYVHPVTGEQVPSVTSVLNMINKPKLPGAAARVAAEYAAANWAELSGYPLGKRVVLIKTAHEREWGAKASLGDTVHDMVDAWCKGVPFPDVPKEIKGFAGQVISFLMDNRPEFIENEVTFWSRTHGYAGTGDAIVRIGGKTYVADWKTGKRLWPEVGMQTAALAGADFLIRADGTEEEIPPLDGIAALHLRPRSWTWQVLDHQKENFQAFLACRALLRWETEFAPAVLGEA